MFYSSMSVNTSMTKENKASKKKTKTKNLLVHTLKHDLLYRGNKIKQVSPQAKFCISIPYTLHIV